MKRMYSRFLVGTAIAVLIAVDPTAGVAQTTFQACRIPDVGAIYMINVAGAPAACLAASHVAFSWTEGGAPADGSITSVKIADGTVAAVDLASASVTSSAITDGTIAAIDVAAGAVTSAGILDATIAAADHGVGSVTSAGILDATIATADLATNAVATAQIANGAVTTAKLAVPSTAAYNVGSGFSVGLTVTRVNVSSVAITVGGAGSIVVNAAGTLEVTSGNCSYVYYGISETSTGAPDNTESYMNRPDYGAVGVYSFGYQATTSVYMDTVAAAGTYTYYFVATDFGATGNCNMYSNGMTAIFIPT